MDGGQPSITISRDGQQYGPYTPDQVTGFLQTGNLLPTDLAWNGQLSTWIPLSSLPGIAFATPPSPPVPRPRNVFLLIVMAIFWWIVMFIVASFIIGFFGGVIGGIIVGLTNPTNNPQEAGRVVGHWLGTLFLLPLFFGSLGLSIWLTVIGKLPGTRKHRLA